MKVSTILAALAITMMLVGCDEAAIQANEQQAAQNQKQIESMQQELAAIQAQGPPYNTAPPPGTPGTCDKPVMETATQRGGDALAASDIRKALGFYQDALTACPGNGRAEMNVARTEEALGNRPDAINHYRAAANPSDNDSTTAQDARAALSRLGAN